MGGRGTLRTIVLTEADGTLTVEAVSPEAGKLNIALAKVGVGDEEPGTKDALGKDIKDGVGNDLTVNTNHARTISETPDNWVGSPEDEGVGSNGNEERSELGALLGSIGTTVQGKVPDDKEVGNAGNGVPAPLLRSTLLAESSKEASQDHDQVSGNGKENVSTSHASQKTEIEKKEGSGDGPVNITGPVDLTLDLDKCVGNMVMLLTDGGGDERNTVTSGHGKVGQGSGDGDGGGDDMVETSAKRDLP